MDEDSAKTNELKKLLKSVLYGKNRTPFVDLLLAALADAGCPVKPEIHIVIEDCLDNCNIIGAFDSYNNQIVLCKNRFNGNESVTSKTISLQQTLSHELIHAFDHCRAHVDFYNNPAHLMCSEIRAASLSGQCMVSQNFVSSALSAFKLYHQHCVRSNALSSFQALYTNWDKEKSQALLDKCFHSCYNDYIPFDRIPFSKKQAELSLEFYKRRYCKF